MDEPERTALYRFFNNNDVLLYIGISNSPTDRWQQHVDDKPWAHEVTMRVIEWLPSRPEALTAEMRAIKSERPKYNIQHQPKPAKALQVRPEFRSPPDSAIACGFLCIADLAYMLSVKVGTVSFYRAHSRPGGRYARDPFPAEDRIFARSPAWNLERADEIKAWNARRPGQGVGGGQPSHQKPAFTAQRTPDKES